jgi:hypothetical protein
MVEEVDIFKQLAFTKAMEKSNKNSEIKEISKENPLTDLSLNKGHVLSVSETKDTNLQKLVAETLQKENIPVIAAPVQTTQDVPKLPFNNGFTPQNNLRKPSETTIPSLNPTPESSGVKIRPISEQPEPFTEYYTLKQGANLDLYSNLDFIKNCGDQIYKIVQYLKQGKNPYNNIRLYTDHA